MMVTSVGKMPEPVMLMSIEGMWANLGEGMWTVDF